MAEETEFADVRYGALDPELEAQGWTLLTRNRVPPTTFELDGDGSIVITVDGSNALIYKPAAAQPEEASELHWSWRVDNVTNEPASFDPAADPDWPVAVYAAFEVDKQYVGWWRRLLNRLRFSAAGLPDTGKILTYVWSLNEPPGPPGPSPYLPYSQTIQVLQTGESTGWRAEQRELRADFEMAWGHPAGRLLYIAVSADGENTATASRARIRNLTVSPSSAPPGPANRATGQASLP